MPAAIAVADNAAEHAAGHAAQMVPPVWSRPLQASAKALRDAKRQRCKAVAATQRASCKSPRSAIRVKI